MVELTELTWEAYQELKNAGRVEQVSEPLSVYNKYGATFDELKKSIEIDARDYPAANHYMFGSFRKVTLEGDFVTPFVLYKVSE